jgi:hypothetical protein
MIDKGEFTHKELIIILARRAFKAGLITKQEIKDMSNSDRNYFRVMKTLKGTDGFSYSSAGKKIYLGEKEG